MMSKRDVRGRLRHVGGLLFFLAGCTATHDTPTDPDPRPSARSWTVTIRQINDSTIAYDLVAADTAPITRIISVTERFTGTTVGPLLWNFHATAETTTVSPPRYNVRISDTLPSRPAGAYYRWAVAGMNTVGWYQWRDGRFYSGPRSIQLDISGIPDVMTQVGLDLFMVVKGPHPTRALRVYVDSGTSAEQSFGPVAADSSILTSGDVDRAFHLWVPGPLPNGVHTFVVAARDSSGASASYKKTLSVAVAARPYHVVPIVVEGAIDSYANGINNLGEVAGSYRLPDSSTRAIRWAGGVTRLLPGPSSSEASVINDSGIVAGYTGRGPRNPAAPTDSIVAWRDTTRTLIASGNGSFTPREIAANGAVLLDRSVWRAGTITPVPLNFTEDLNDAGVVVGYIFDIGPPNRAVRATGPVVTSVVEPYVSWGLPNSPHCCASNARFINNAGQIIGSNGAGIFLSDGATAYWTINPLGRGTVEAMSKGDKVLSRLTDGSIAVWTIGGPTTRVVLDAPGWTVDALTGVNDRGQIIAHGVNGTTGQKAALFLDPM